MSVKGLDLLKSSPLLDGIGDDLVQRLVGVGRHRNLKGQFGRIDHEELSRRLFFVVSGEMRMLRTAPDGQEHLLQRFKIGEFFCLAAAVSSFACNSQMVNSGATELIYWNHDIFRQFMADSKNFHVNILCQMASQVEQEREMRTISSCCKADVKVAAYLLHKIKYGHCLSKFSCSVDIKPISLAAQELGIARETLSRSLQRLIKREGITYQRGIVQVTDIACLEAILEESECSCSC